MSKKILLPSLAFMGIRKNSSTYIPYLAACVFSVFAYFVFDSILYNDIMKQLPRASYALVLMRLGLILLGLILVPFLFYTNSFLVKRRGKELGLYSILGLEKKHIGVMMALETLYIYVFVMTIGILTGMVFAKLVFLLLLNMAGLPIDAVFTLQWKAVGGSAVFFGFISVLNLAVNLFQVGRTNPANLMGKSRKGEKEQKGLWIFAVLGVLALLAGYYFSFSAELDSLIFFKFFGAILLVVIGTYFLFTWGSIAILRILRANKKFYYRKENFITLSGMYGRMRKSAASLVNICIFSTMVIITLLCTSSLYAGTEGIMKTAYPYTLQLQFGELTDTKKVEEGLINLVTECGGKVDTLISYRHLDTTLNQEEEQFSIHSEIERRYALEGKYQVQFIPLEDYNALQGTTYELKPDEVMVYSTGSDYGYERIKIENKEYWVKEELNDSLLRRKSKGDVFTKEYYIILPDMKELTSYIGMWEEQARQIQSDICIEVTGDKTAIEAFIQEASVMVGSREDFIGLANGYAGRLEIQSMDGSLLFIGIFFGLVFMMCMLLIMYYKQITEGFEDKNNFDIMQQVGMSDREVRSTIKKQVFMVFFIPLAGAILHTAAGLPMIIKLMGAIRLFDVPLLLWCSAAVVVAFGFVYLGSYLITARAYYRIVHSVQ